MSYLDAAAITMNYTVAYILLFEMANITPGKSLLLHSAGGGVVSKLLSMLFFTVSDIGFWSGEQVSSLCTNPTSWRKKSDFHNQNK